MTRVLILTSSYPSSDDDNTCGYIRGFARSLAVDYDVTVLAPPDDGAMPCGRDGLWVKRSGPAHPSSFNRFKASVDFNSLVDASFLSKIFSMSAALRFAYDALRLARTADVVCSHWLVPCGLIGSLAARAARKP